MFKKITSILLCITLLLTLSPVTGVFAAVTETNGTLTENFENMSVTDAYFKFKGSQLENHAFLTNSYDEGTKNFSASREAYKIVEKQGADGKLSKMLEMRSPVGTSTDSIVGLGLPSYAKADLDAGKLMKYSYDFCIEKIPTSASVFTVSAPYLNMFYYNASGTLASNSANFDPTDFVIGASATSTSSTNATLAAGNWYRAEMSAGENEYLYFSVYDKSGTRIYTNATAKDKHYNDSRKVTDTKNHERLLGTVALGTVTEENAGFTVLIDNAEYRVCKPASAGPVLKTGSTFTEATIKSGDTVAINIGEATVAFDQKLEGDFKATLTPSGGTPVECAMKAGKAYASSYFYTVSIPELVNKTDYTLSFENCKNAQAQSCESTIAFRAEGAIDTSVGIIKTTEDFETYLINDSKTGYKGYNTGKKADSIFYSETKSNYTGTISYGEGYNGGKALRFATGTEVVNNSHIAPLQTHTTYVQAVNPADETQCEQYVVTYRIKVEKAGEKGTTYTLGEDEYTTDGTSISFFNGDTALSSKTIAKITDRGSKLVVIPGSRAADSCDFESAEILENKWYNIVWTVDGKKQIFQLLDPETGKLMFICNGDFLFPEGYNRFGIFYGPCTYDTTKKTIVNHNMTALVDDFTLWQIRPWEAKQKLALEKDLTLSGEKVTFNFNQPVVLKRGNLDTTSDAEHYVYPDIHYKDFCTAEVTLNNLTPGQTYTLDYSDAKGVCGTTFDGEQKFEFTVPTPEKAATLNVEATGANAGDTVTFDYWTKEAGEVNFITALYDKAANKKLVGVEIAKRNVIAGKNDISIEFTKDYSANAKELVVFTLDNDTKVKPLTETVKLPCSDTLKVLMIGNSLSEDANRHLNKVAELGGLELDLTVAGIGGSGLPIHAANLEAELAGRTKDEALDLIKAGNYEHMLLYWIYDNGVCRGTSYIYRERLLDMLTAKEYDVISLQQYGDYGDSAFGESLPYLTEQIRKLQPDAELVLYQTWSESYKSRESRSLLFDTIKAPANEKWAALTPQLVSGITEGDAPMRIIPAGTAFYVADEMYEIFGEKLPGTEGNTNEGVQDENEYDFSVSTSLWRDKNHASYYGCYLADAVWFECLTGRKAPIGTIDAPAVPRPTAADITPEEHIQRLEYLSDIAHGVVMARR